MANKGNSWVVGIERELNAVDTSSELWMKHSIYMVPALIKDLNPTAYKPQIISFGPYHYGDEELRPMEIHKRRALIHFLKRAQKPLEGFMSALEEVADVLMDSYQSLDKRCEEVADVLMDSYQSLYKRWREEREEFLRLMLVDGCFMLEVLRFCGGYTHDYALNDPIFSSHGMSYIMLHIKMDMLRIENQLPLLVLKKLVAAETGRAPDDDGINKLVLDFMGFRQAPSGVGAGLHPLDLFRKCCQQATATQASARRIEAPETEEDHLPIDEEADFQVSILPPETDEHPVMTGSAAPRGRKRGRAATSHFGTVASRREAVGSTEEPRTDEDLEDIDIPSASWLVEAGIRFRKSKTDSLRNISFEDGVLSLPTITVDDTTECVFLNLMAFERLHVGAGNEITSYVFFMDNMVDSAKDVTLLESKGIILNFVGTDKAVAELFNSLGKYVSLNPESRLRNVLRSVNQYYTRDWNMWRAKMIHFYFKSPVANSVAAFVFLLLLTLLQTVYAVLQYYTRSS